jgi:hypothetical protein
MSIELRFNNQNSGARTVIDVYRDTQPIPDDTALLPIDTIPGTATNYVDKTNLLHVKYYYRLLIQRPGFDKVWSPEFTYTERAVAGPGNQQPISQSGRTYYTGPVTDSDRLPTLEDLYQTLGYTGTKPQGLPNTFHRFMYQADVYYLPQDIFIDIGKMDVENRADFFNGKQRIVHNGDTYAIVAHSAFDQWYPMGLYTNDMSTSTSIERLDMSVDLIERYNVLYGGSLTELPIVTSYGATSNGTHRLVYMKFTQVTAAVSNSITLANDTGYFFIPTLRLVRE